MGWDVMVNGLQRHPSLRSLTIGCESLVPVCHTAPPRPPGLSQHQSPWHFQAPILWGPPWAPQTKRGSLAIQAPILWGPPRPPDLSQHQSPCRERLSRRESRPRHHSRQPHNHTGDGLAPMLHRLLTKGDGYALGSLRNLSHLRSRQRRLKTKVQPAKTSMTT